MATARFPLESVVYAVQLNTSTKAWLAVNPESEDGKERV